jgi:hypothetical protein
VYSRYQDTGGKFATCTAGVVDTVGNINDNSGTRSKFATGINDICGDLATVSMTPVENNE